MSVSNFTCNPRSPWQRSSNENTNGLLRQYDGYGGIGYYHVSDESPLHPLRCQ